MRRFLIPAAAVAAFLFVASPSESNAQVVVRYGTPTYSYSPYYGGYSQPYYGGYSQSYYRGYSQPYYGGSGINLSTGGLNLSYGSSQYSGYNRGYSTYYGGSPNAWSVGNRGYYSTGRGFRR